MRSILACLAVVLACAWAAPAAPAQSRCVAPPGSSAVDEYCEVVPNGTGGNASGGGPGAGGVPGSAASGLERSGPIGHAVLSLAGGARPTQKRDRGGNKDRGGSATTKPADEQQQKLPDQDQGKSSNNVIEAAAASTSEATRVGPGFIWILLVAIVAVGAWGWVAYRRGHRGASGGDAGDDK